MERQGLAFFRTSGSRMMSAASHGSLATILLLRGDLAGAEHEAQAAVEDATGNRQIEASNQGILAHVLLARGRSADALVSSRSAHAILDELGAVEEREMLIRLVHAEALAANGEQEPARAILAAARERLLTLASRIGDLDMRRRFLGNVPENVRTLQLASQWLGPERSPAGG